MPDTRENILRAALRLFAQDGYEAVSMSRIAGELGLTKGALYRHYESKAAILASLLAHMEALDARRARELAMPEQPMELAPDAYADISIARVIRFCEAQFTYWTQDPFAAEFRRMLTLEQYRNAEMAALYHQYLCAGPLAYAADVLPGGAAEAKLAALALYAPMFMLYSLYDAAEDKAEVCALLQAHLQSFAQGYRARREANA